MKSNLTRLQKRKQLLPLTLQYSSDELRGFNRLAKKFGTTPTKLVQQAVVAGVPLVVADLEAKHTLATPSNVNTPDSIQE